MVSDLAVPQCGQVMTDAKFIIAKPMYEVASYELASERAIASQFVARWAGYPALVLAAAMASGVAVASSKTTVAILLL